MIDLNRKSTLKKIELIEKSAKKRSMWSSIDDQSFIDQFHVIKGPIGTHTYELISMFGFRSSDLLDP